MDRTEETMMSPTATVACGPEGLDAALQRGDLAVIVDVLRFSSAVTTAVANGFTILPRSKPDDGARTSTGDVPRRATLSPLDFLNPKSPEEVLLVSPNGAFLAGKVGEKDAGFIGCFLNGRTVARIVSAVAAREGRNIALIAAGEIEEDRTDGVRIPRFAVEDWLGCGFILSEMRMERTAEAEICARTYDSCKPVFVDLIRKSLSGQYLIGRGKEYDISHCLQRNIYGIVPVVRGAMIVKYEEEMYG
jgi:2-phosphosulfolactate phosphatase